jgi:tRNA pseudouridine13 synthase
VQWFSVPRPRMSVDWSRLEREHFAVLEAHPHSRKLPRGALSGNHFAVRVRATTGDGASLAAQIAPRLAEIAHAGVPNYFGPQRFGRDGANLARSAAASLGTLRGAERGFVLSAARSVVFNAVLAARVVDGSWNRLLGGDLANLAGRGSVFPVEHPDAVLVSRCERLEIHPSGPLWGEGEPATRGRVLELESHVAARFPAQCRLCAHARMRQERRSLRLEVEELGFTSEAQAVRLTFRLRRGGFATAVLRELVTTEDDVPED